MVTAKCVICNKTTEPLSYYEFFMSKKIDVKPRDFKNAKKCRMAIL